MPGYGLSSTVLVPVTAEMLSDSDGPVMLQVEAAINKANAIVGKLPKIVLDRLDKDMLRGLNDMRNVARTAVRSWIPHS